MMLAVPALENFARAGDAVFTHPATDHGVITNPAATPEQLAAHKRKLETTVRDILALTDAQLLALVPEQTPRIHHACPVCSEREPVDIPEQPRPFPGRFDPLKPNQITCAKCGTVFPNPAYPMSHTETLRNMLGEDVTVPYYLDPKGRLRETEIKKHQERRYYFNGVVDTARKIWLLPRLSALGELYQMTGDERYARPVVLVLDEMAKRYPHYLLTTDYGHRYVTTVGQKPPYGYVDTRWGRRSYNDQPAEILAIFDLVAASKHMGADAKKRIRENFFLNTLREVPAGKVPRRPELYGNTSGPGNMIERAKVLESPELMHAAYRFIRDVPRYATECDGMFLDSAGYASLFCFSFFGGARKIDGYTDPAGYRDAVDGLHLENVHPLKDNEEYFRALTTVARKLRLPSGGLVSYNDSGSNWGERYWSAIGDKCEPPGRSANVLLPGLRRAILGAGEGDRQIQVHLGFGENGVNHGHQDALAMQIYAYGHSLIDDFPYHKSTLRRYAEMSLAHATVVIDQKNQNGSRTDGNVEFYAPLMDGVAAIRVDNTRAYTGTASRYARTLVLNSIDTDAPYVIDIFEVTGGALHDYHLRSSGQHRESVSVSAPTTPLLGLRPLMAAGEKWTEPKIQREGIGSGYGLLFDARRAAVTPGMNFTYTCEDPWAGAMLELRGGQQHQRTDGAWRAGPDSWPDNPAIGTRHHVAVDSTYELIVAASPSLAETGFYGLEKPSEQWPRIPHAILRHRVSENGGSVFVVVHEPWHHAPKIRAVERVKTADEKTVALRITFADGREDVFVCALDKPREVTAAGVTLNGRMALVSRPKAGAPRAYLVEGTGLRATGVALAPDTADFTGKIAAMERRISGRSAPRFRIESTGAATLPAGDALRGQWIIVRHGPIAPDAQKPDAPALGEVDDTTHYGQVAQAFEIDRVTSENGATWVYTQGDHGLDMEGGYVHEFYVPGRAFKGASSFVIPTFATTNALAPEPREQPLEIAPATATAEGKRGLRVEDFAGEGHDFSKMQPVASAMVEQVDAKRFFERSKRVAARYAGNLCVPADGVYTFYVGATSECRFTLNGVTVIEQFHGQSLMPDKREVRLKAGVYPLTLEYYHGSTSLPAWVCAEWEGPGLERQDVARSAKTR